MLAAGSFHGKAVSDRIRVFKPEVKAICMHGDASDVAQNKGFGGNEVPHLPRQVTADQLLRRAREVLDT
jgi:hypothetical protein